jgi:hypothetical protein
MDREAVLALALWLPDAQDDFAVVLCTARSEKCLAGVGQWENLVDFWL